VPWPGVFLSLYAALTFFHCLFGIAYVTKCARGLARMG
jgi:hypothetical protein